MTIFEKNRDLLDRFREGDRDALSEVYFFYINDIEAMIRRGHRTPNAFVIRDFDKQQDLIQEVFMRAFAKSARLGFDGLRPYRPYLLSIAKNAIIDYLRKLPREAMGFALNDDDDEALIASFSTGTVSDAEVESSRESGVHWDRCLSASKEYIATLDETQQAFVDLRFKQELPQLSVAKSLKMTRWKVRALEKKIYTGLRKYLTRAKLLEKES